MEIIIHQAILHVLDTTLDAPVLSGSGMEMTAEKTAYLQNHIEKLLASRQPPEAIRMAGGPVQSKVWVQLFADVLGFPIETVDAKELGALGCAMAAAIAAGQGVPRPSDIGKLNGRPFVYVAAFGAFTKVAYETPQDLKNTFGHLAYVMAGIASLPSIPPYHIKVEYDGNVLEDDFYFGMVSNAYSIGGIRLPTSEHVVLDDGLFEVDLVKKPVSIADVANGFQALLDQNQPSAGSRVHFKASHLTFTCEKPIPWTIDGEFGGKESVNEIVNCQRALTIIRGS